MVRTEISLFMKNEPGELGKLATLFGKEKINIDALAIQDASKYVQELFKARGKSLKRIASAASYNSMRKDSAEFALVRMLVDDTDKAIDLLDTSATRVKMSLTSKPPKLELLISTLNSLELEIRALQKDHDLGIHNRDAELKLLLEEQEKLAEEIKASRPDIAAIIATLVTHQQTQRAAHIIQRGKRDTSNWKWISRWERMQR